MGGPESVDEDSVSVSYSSRTRGSSTETGRTMAFITNHLHPRDDFFTSLAFVVFQFLVSCESETADRHPLHHPPGMEVHFPVANRITESQNHRITESQNVWG